MADIIREMVALRAHCTDDEILAELDQLIPLPDEGDPAWDLESTWHAANLFVALADVAATRRLRPAIGLLLDRACYGDPGEMMRGLRHSLEAIVNPNWSELATICLEAAKSPRLGTRLWAIDELGVLEDSRAMPIFEAAIRNGPDDIRECAERGLGRLN